MAKDQEMAAYSIEEYYDMLMALGECHGQQYIAARRYVELYPNRARHPHASVILEAAERLYETGSVLPKKKDAGRQRYARNVRNTETVLLTIEQEPETKNLPDFLEDVPLLDRNKIIFQQDGAGPHKARIVTDFLNQQFPARWMGRYGPIRWPTRSPDLNPLDFFLWGYCKEKIYRQLPEDVEELNNKLHDAVWSIDNDVMERVQANLLRRMRACVTMDGEHFEHLL
ncbi:PREDICTED: uncharacterized protein LOC108764871 [Trachymyrmex cornetzi]|uniref:uncharacterized protein LOC108764871 n=1 Tax=Trachymyrmex cornetzi TaxID=471704 RepID=UPI00084EE91E|nr:PREDICTED: uncharacterized protein LOC108764871 [Trachymyrmex cornetzi]